MTPQEQIKALAELDGWFVEHSEDGLYLRHIAKCVVCGPFKTEDEAWDYAAVTFSLRNLLTSYDAIIPLIQKQTADMRFAIHMHTPCRSNYWSINVQATPAQLCEALLRATGKWKG